MQRVEAWWPIVLASNADLPARHWAGVGLTVVAGVLPGLFVAKEITLETEDIVIEWSDGHMSRYPHRELRIECACAVCVEEMTGRQLLDVLSVPGDIFAVDFLLVGRYAVQFAWSDGHSTGIYPFTLLRHVCRCGVDHSSEDPAPEKGPRRAGR